MDPLPPSHASSIDFPPNSPGIFFFARPQVHYHFMGSYTASGDGNDAECEGNLGNVRLAHEHDMGVFVISVFDKGGRLYAPSHLCRELTLPEMEPMEYGAAWLWHHDAPVHTIVCGAARPSDLDQPVLAALRSVTDGGRRDFEVVSSRVRERRDRVLGERWASTWHVGLPNYTQSEGRGFQIGNMVWLHNVVRMYGMLDYARDRYNTMVGNSAKWDINKTWRENVFARPGFSWMPGCAYDPSHDYGPDLRDVPEGNRARVLEAMEFVHEWCCPARSKSMPLEAGAEDEKKDEDGKGNVIPLEWQAAYDMRPWTAFPERLGEVMLLDQSLKGVLSTYKLFSLPRSDLTTGSGFDRSHLRVFYGGHVRFSSSECQRSLAEGKVSWVHRIFVTGSICVGVIFWHRWKFHTKETNIPIQKRESQDFL